MSREILEISKKTDKMMQNKVCLITGGTYGIGRATAHELAKQGANLIIVGHNAERGKQAEAEIKTLSGNDSVVFLQADMSSQAAIRQLSKEVQARYEQLHVLINNVGNMQSERKETIDSIELTFALNVLAPFLLTNLLLPQLKASTPSRIINVNSTAHTFVKSLSFDDLQARQAYKPMNVYSKAKLANLLFTYELARRLDGTNCTVNAADPGFTIRTPSPGTAHPWYTYLLWPLTKLGSLIMTDARAAQSSIYLATASEVAKMNGQYINTSRRSRKSSAASYEVSAAQRLWSVCAELTGIAE